MGIEEYLTEIKNQIRDKKAREFVTNELQAHIEDRVEGLRNKGMDHDRAILQAVEEMVDPVSVGVSMDRIHRPRLEWKFLLYVIYISILSMGIMFFISSVVPPESVVGSEATGLLLKHIVSVLVGLAAMIIVYRLDYTILSGRSRLIAAVFLTLLTFFFFFFSQVIPGVTRLISFCGITILPQPIFILYLPMFAGILYDYRKQGGDVFFKIFLWMIAPVFSLMLCRDEQVSYLIFMLFSEIILFMIAFNKKWYQVDRRKFLKGAGIGFVAITALLVFRIVILSEYQSLRLQAWLSHFGISFGSSYEDNICFTNKYLVNVIQKSNFIGKSDSAIEALLGIDSLGDFILVSISATCGRLAVGVIIITLIVLAIYIFGISVKQKNSLGSIVGCGCGIVIAVQALSNFFIVFDFLPSTATTLPFFSVGINYILVDYILLGLVLSIYRYQDIRVEKDPVITSVA